MKKIKLLVTTLLLVSMCGLESCGPVIISARPNIPPPPWFYPGRAVNVRYVYFPNHMIYYDLSLRHYLYFEGDVWISVEVLPARFRNLNLRRERFVRVNNYFGDNIRDYHRSNRVSIKGRRN